MRLKVLTMSLLLLVFGCGKKQEIACIVGNQDVIVGGESGQELSPTQVFRKNNGTEPGTLDPHRAEGVPASNVLRDLFEGLVMEDPSGAYISGAAESWSLSEDAKTYVFKMRENGKWSNGDVVTAEDFVYGLRRSVDPATLSNYSSMLYPIKNARDIVLGKRSSETLGVRANGPTTLIIELEEPTPYFLSLLTHSTTYATHRPSVEKFGARFTRPGNLVGNGAFKLEEWRVQSHIKLVRNTEYWDNKNTTLEEVYYYPIDDVNSSFKRYRAQELDFTETVLAEQLPWIRQCLPGDLKISPYFGSYYYGFNNTQPPFKNKPKLRTALSMAVDRNVITDIILGAGQIPAYSLVPSVKTFKAVPANWSQWTQEQRNQEAQRLYSEAGFSKEKPLEVEILYNTSDNHKRIALAIAAMWKQTLGVKTTLRNQEWKVFLETRRLKQGTQVYRAGWIGDYDDPYTFSQLLHSENEMNHPGYSSEEYDELINLAATKNAGESRLDVLRQAEKAMLEDMPIIPIYFYVSQHLIKPRVSGLEGNVMDHHYSKYVRILKTEAANNNGQP
jgi:oligopeptide transport system substrate-binding protein